VPADEAFDRFYAETFGVLAGYAWSLTGERTAAEDLAQEAMARVYARWFALREPQPYAFRIVTNLARDKWRRRRHEIAAQRELLAEDTPAADLSVLDAVERLPEQLRDVVLLYYYADLPVDEVARAIRRPVGTVKRRLHEARAHLAAALGGQP
jgi:RNA polymerase sigma-70 factor (ECF subfamily)